MALEIIVTNLQKTAKRAELQARLAQFERGYGRLLEDGLLLDAALTAQEIALCPIYHGRIATHPEILTDPHLDRYTPLGILAGHDPDAIARHRAALDYLPISPLSLACYGKGSRDLREIALVTLEPLDRQDQTITDPKLAHEDLYLRCSPIARQAARFPYQRN